MSWDKLRARSHALLWFGTDDDKRDRWSITDPESERLAEACRRLRPRGPSENGGQWPVRTPEEQQRDSDIYVLLRVVHDYQHLTTYDLGVEHILKKLRVIWRALREAREKEPDGEAG
jgi:hypothetical protein